jgi:hypothetical protein
MVFSPQQLMIDTRLSLPSFPPLFIRAQHSSLFGSKFFGRTLKCRNIVDLYRPFLPTPAAPEGYFELFLKVTRAGEQTRYLLFLFIFSFHHFTAEPQRLPGLFLASPLVPRGEIWPLEEIFTPLFTPRGEHSLLFRRMGGCTENFNLRGQNSLLGDNFAPRVKVCPLGAKLRMCLSRG